MMFHPHPHPRLKVTIAPVDLVGEVVRIENRSTKSIDISGWVLVGESCNQRFMFPVDTAFPAGTSVTVVSGPNATAGEGRLLWTGLHIWNNDGDPAVLLDAERRQYLQAA